MAIQLRQKLLTEIKMLLSAYTCLPLLLAATIIITDTSQLLLPLTIASITTTTQYCWCCSAAATATIAINISSSSSSSRSVTYWPAL